MVSARKYKGYIGVADELITFNPEFKEIFSSLLGRTVIFDNIDNATEMAKAQSYKIKVVTLDGQQVNVGGSFTGGSVKHEGTVLSRSNDIKKMEEEEKEIAKKLEKVKSEGQKLGEELRALTSKHQGNKQQYDLTDKLYRAEKTEYDTVAAQINLNKEIIDSLHTDTQKLISEDEKNKNELIIKREEKEQIESRIEEIYTLRIDLDVQKYEFVEIPQLYYD
jgi:chromosome segregation protein